MEVFIGFLLLIGAFTLGATASNSGDAGDGDTVVIQAAQDGSHSRASEGYRPCRFAEGALVQRDLTAPRLLLEVSYDVIPEVQDTASRD